MDAKELNKNMSGIWCVTTASSVFLVDMDDKSLVKVPTQYVMLGMSLPELAETAKIELDWLSIMDAYAIRGGTLNIVYMSKKTNEYQTYSDDKVISIKACSDSQMQAESA